MTRSIVLIDVPVGIHPKKIFIPKEDSLCLIFWNRWWSEPTIEPHARHKLIRFWHIARGRSLSTRKNIVLFLGAGASMPYELPTTEKLLTLLRESYSDRPILHSLLQCGEFIDIEYVLQAMKDMLRFHQTGGDTYYRWQGEQGHMLIPTQVGQQYTYTQFIEQLPDTYRYLQGEVFDNYVLDVARYAPRLNAILMPILKFLRSHSTKITVFTTNYDRVIEEFTQQQPEQFTLIDGFRSELNQNFVFDPSIFEHNELESKCPIFLYKLHGSLNWFKGVDGKIQRMPVDSKLPPPNKNLLIYPTRSPKDDSNVEPYITLFKKFKTNMENADVLIAIGSSFRDKAIADKISEQFVNRKKQIIILSPTGISDYYQNLLHKEYVQDQSLQILRPNRRTLILNQKLDEETSQEIVDEFENFLNDV